MPSSNPTHCTKTQHINCSSFLTLYYSSSYSLFPSSFPTHCANFQLTNCSHSHITHCTSDHLTYSLFRSSYITHSMQQSSAYLLFPSTYMYNKYHTQYKSLPHTLYQICKNLNKGVRQGANTLNPDTHCTNFS